MIPLKVKICGITNPADASTAVEAGADALGFMFYRPSPRWVACERAAEIIRELPPFVAKVGVFVNPTEQEVRRAIGDGGLDTLQFHGEEPPPPRCGKSAPTDWMFPAKWNRRRAKRTPSKSVTSSGQPRPPNEHLRRVAVARADP